MKRLVFASALAAAASLAGCGATEAHHPAPEPAPVPVTVGVAHDEPLAVLYRASGTVRGRNTTVLTSKTMGYVRAVRVRSGDRVTAGQPLLQLEANDVRASVARARAGLEQSTAAKTEAESALEAARVAAKVAKSSHDRAALLLKDNAIPQQQYDDAEARWRGAAAQEQMAQARVRSLASSIDEAKAALGEAQVTLGYADIVAPFAGRVLERRVDPGTLAAPGTPLLVIGDEGTLRVEAAVEESRADQVKVGDEVDVAIEMLPRPVVGRVGEIVPSVDVASRAFLVKIDLPSEVGALRPGTFARVSFHVGARPRLVVPTTAISSFGALDRVFVVDGAHARLRMITRGDTQGAWTEVLSGLSPNERVALSPVDLRDGAPVEVR
jgi:RND family efflux transporter MFP subunit